MSFNNRIFCLSAAGVSDSIGSGIYDYTLIAAGWMSGITDHRLLRFNNSFFGTGSSSSSDVAGTIYIASLKFLHQKSIFFDVGFKYCCCSTRDSRMAKNMAY